MLQKMLNQEEKMHEVLEHILNQHNGSAVSIPNFLPPKVNFFSFVTWNNMQHRIRNTYYKLPVAVIYDS